MTELAPILERAKKIIERGWHKGSYVNSDGGYCIVGALGMAYTDGRMYDYVPSNFKGPLEDHLADFGWTCQASDCSFKLRGEVCQHLPHFNDDPNTTKEMVLALFDKALADS
jgi:hypothetical protein